MITNMQKKLLKFDNINKGYFNMPFSKSGMKITNTFKRNLKNLELNTSTLKDKMLFYLTLLSEEVFNTEATLETKHHKKMPTFEK